MNATSTVQPMAFDTVSLDIPKADITFFKTLAKKMGWKINKKAQPAKPQKKSLYDPESGCYLNDETMKVIEDAENGIGLEFMGSVEEFKEWAKNL